MAARPPDLPVAGAIAGKRHGRAADVTEDLESLRWRERLLKACQHAADHLSQTDDPFQRQLRVDLIDLRDRLRA